MNIWTSFFDNRDNIPREVVQISIAGKAPEWYSGIQYKRLAPKWSFWQEWEKNGDNDYYIEHFNKEVLAPLNKEAVREALAVLSKGKDCVLLCYELPGEFCHRHLVAQWLGNDVKEWE